MGWDGSNQGVGVTAGATGVSAIIGVGAALLSVVFDSVVVVTVFFSQPDARSEPSAAAAARAISFLRMKFPPLLGRRPLSGRVPSVSDAGGVPCREGAISSAVEACSLLHSSFPGTALARFP